MMLTRWLYWHNPDTETIHLADEDFAARTLCGVTTLNLEEGDDSLSGRAANCGGCNRVRAAREI